MGILSALPGSLPTQVGIKGPPDTAGALEASPYCSLLILQHRLPRFCHREKDHGNLETYLMGTMAQIEFKRESMIM